MSGRGGPGRSAARQGALLGHLQPQINTAAGGASEWWVAPPEAKKNVRTSRIDDSLEHRSVVHWNPVMF